MGPSRNENCLSLWSGGGIAVVQRVLPTTVGRIVPALDNQPGLLLSPSGIRLCLLTQIVSSLSGSFFERRRLWASGFLKQAAPLFKICCNQCAALLFIASFGRNIEPSPPHTSPPH